MIAGIAITVARTAAVWSLSMRERPDKLRRIYALAATGEYTIDEIAS